MAKSRRKSQTFDPAFFPAPLPPPPQYIDPVPVVTLSVLGAKNATVAKAHLSKYRWDGQGGEMLYEFTAADSSKREQGDQYDAETGELLALARTLQRLSRDLFSEADKRVKAAALEQERLEAERERKAEEAKKPVKRRTREEWEALQATPARVIPQAFLDELFDKYN